MIEHETEKDLKVKMQMRPCEHPKLATLPIEPGYVLGIACLFCEKRLLLRYGEVVDVYPGASTRKEFCLAELITETFGEAWGQRAAKDCRCSQHKSEGSHE